MFRQECIPSSCQIIRSTDLGKVLHGQVQVTHAEQLQPDAILLPLTSIQAQMP